MEDPEATDWDDSKSVPQTANKAARRALVLAAVVCRGSIDHGADNPDAEDLHKRIVGWLSLLNLWDEVEPSEEAMLRAPLGQLETKTVIRATWYVEGLAILAWALKHSELPKHEEQVDPIEVTDALWFLSEDAEDVISNAELRSPVELEACREVLYAIHCRLTDYRRHRTQLDFMHWVEKDWLDALGLNASNFIVNNDLAVEGESIIKVKKERLQELLSMTLERHRAIIWLVEGYASYSETPVDT